MAFGNYKIRADFGGERITDRNSATAFMLALTAIYRNKPHWKLADQALRQASKSAAAESRASAAFKAAIEAEGWLEIDYAHLTALERMDDDSRHGVRGRSVRDLNAR
jgi:hypothetical protein